MRTNASSVGDDQKKNGRKKHEPFTLPATAAWSLARDETRTTDVARDAFADDVSLELVIGKRDPTAQESQFKKGIVQDNRQDKRVWNPNQSLGARLFREDQDDFFLEDDLTALVFFETGEAPRPAKPWAGDGEDVRAVARAPAELSENARAVLEHLVAMAEAEDGDVPGDGPGDGGDGDDPRDDPDLRSETFERHLAELTAMHEEESAWLDRLEAQPRRSATAASGEAATRAPAGDIPGDIPGDDARAENLVGSSRDPEGAVPEPAARVFFNPFDPGAASYMRRNYAELVRLREEERALVARLDRLAATEEDLHARIAEAARRRDDALRARENETETRTDLGGDGTTSFALAAAERDHHSRVNAVDALARWRR